MKALNNTGNPLQEQPTELKVILRENGKDTVIGGEKMANEMLIGGEKMANEMLIGLKNEVCDERK